MPASVGPSQPDGSQLGDGRALRSGYRDLHARAIRDGEDLVSLEKSKLAEMLAEANTLQEQVQRPREQAVDSEVFAHLTDRGVELAKKLAHGGRGHTAKDFLRRLKAKFVSTSQPQDDGTEDPNAFNWQQMGEQVLHLFRPAPGIFCMVGPLDAQPKARKAPVRHARQQLAAVVRPEQVDDALETEKQETDRNLDEVWGVLLAEQSVPLLELVVNHRSFAQTVENLFSVSFLVKDGRVSLNKSERGLIVNRVPPRSEDEGAPPEVERMQFVVNLTMAVWEEWKQYCDPADFRLKHRDPRDQGTDTRPSQSPASSDGVDMAAEVPTSPAAAAAMSDEAAAEANGAGPSEHSSAAEAVFPMQRGRKGTGSAKRKSKGVARSPALVDQEQDEDEDAEPPRKRSSIKQGRKQS